jgi:putative endonuclease
MAMNERQAAAHKLGELGEDEAARWYRKAGFQIVARNWRCFEGEIDIIARRGRTTVVCEVKTRASGRFMDPALAVSHSKQNKVRTAAYRWLDENQSLGRLRFDVALVVNGQVQILEAAF